MSSFTQSIKVVRQLQRGFSLVTAIFLLVILASLGALMMTFFTAQQQSSALDVLGSRAYQAARAGVEWGAYQVLPNSADTFATSCRPPTGAASQVISPLAGTLSPFAVTVGCTATSADEGGNILYVYNITASAVMNGATPGGADYVERVMQATIASGVSSAASGIIYLHENY